MTTTSQADGGVSVVELQETMAGDLRNALQIIENGRVSTLNKEFYSLSSNDISAIGARLTSALARVEASEAEGIVAAIEVHSQNVADATSQIRRTLGELRVIGDGRWSVTEDQFNAISRAIHAIELSTSALVLPDDDAEPSDAPTPVEGDKESYDAMHTERNELLRALFQYGEHKKKCASFVGDPCSCGLAAFLVEDKPDVVDNGEGAE